MSDKTFKTIVGDIDGEVLSFTAGADIAEDLNLVGVDCIGTAAHVLTLAELKTRPAPMTRAEARRVIGELAGIMRRAARGAFRISLADQDAHMAVERVLTARLGKLGKKVHTGRSRNDQAAVDMRLFGKEQMQAAMIEAAALAETLLRAARRHKMTPMAGRTHCQPAMPSTVGLWASAHAESLLDDMNLLRAVYTINDKCPLGAAAGYGAPLPLDRRLTARLLGFRAPQHNVLYAVNARGKIEAAVLSAMTQIMLTLSRLAEDLILFGMPEFGYFRLPARFCTGSSIMPQKRNPDVAELVRARTSRVAACHAAAVGIIKSLPSGYNRDMQETKAPYIEGLRMTRECLRIMKPLMENLEIDAEAMRRGFTAGVFAADKALALAAGGMPFRDAYNLVKANLSELESADPAASAAAKRHLGAPGGLELDAASRATDAAAGFARREQARYFRAVSTLMGVKYPLHSMAALWPQPN